MWSSSQKIARHLRHERFANTARLGALFILVLSLLAAGIVLVNGGGDVALNPCLGVFAVFWKAWPRRCPFCDGPIEGLAYPVRGRRCPICNAGAMVGSAFQVVPQMSSQSGDVPRPVIPVKTDAEARP